MKRAAGAPADSAQDPVCGMTVAVGEARAAQWLSRHQGQVFYFCHPGCKQKFDQHPGRFLQKRSLPWEP